MIIMSKLDACSDWMAASLVFLGFLMFDGVPAIVLTLNISAVLLFATAMSAYAKEKDANVIIKIRRRAKRLARASYGLAFTLVILTLAITIYLRSDFQYAVIVILIAWIIMLIYELALHDGVDRANWIWIFIELIGVALLWLDATGVFVWL